MWDDTVVGYMGRDTPWLDFLGLSKKIQDSWKSQAKKEEESRSKKKLEIPAPSKEQLKSASAETDRAIAQFRKQSAGFLADWKQQSEASERALGAYLKNPLEIPKDLPRMKPPEPVNAEQLRDKLVNLAQDRLKKWKTTGKLDGSLGEFIIQAEVLERLMRDGSFDAKQAEEKYLEWYRADRRELGAIGDIHSARIFLHQKYIGNYRRNNASMTDYYEGVKGNCVASSLLYTAHFLDNPKFIPSDHRFGVQVYRDHLQPELFQKKNEFSASSPYMVRSLVSGENVEGVEAPLLDPAFFYEAFLNKHGKTSQISPEKFVLVNSDASASNLRHFFSPLDEGDDGRISAFKIATWGQNYFADGEVPLESSIQYKDMLFSPNAEAKKAGTRRYTSQRREHADPAPSQFASKRMNWTVEGSISGASLFSSWGTLNSNPSGKGEMFVKVFGLTPEQGESVKKAVQKGDVDAIEFLNGILEQERKKVLAHPGKKKLEDALRDPFMAVQFTKQDIQEMGVYVGKATSLSSQLRESKVYTTFYENLAKGKTLSDAEIKKLKERQEEVPQELTYLQSKKELLNLNFFNPTPNLLNIQVPDRRIHADFESYFRFYTQDPKRTLQLIEELPPASRRALFDFWEFLGISKPILSLLAAQFETGQIQVKKPEAKPEHLSQQGKQVEGFSFTLVIKKPVELPSQPAYKPSQVEAPLLGNPDGKRAFESQDKIRPAVPGQEVKNRDYKFPRMPTGAVSWISEDTYTDLVQEYLAGIYHIEINPNIGSSPSHLRQIASIKELFAKGRGLLLPIDEELFERALEKLSSFLSPSELETYRQRLRVVLLHNLAHMAEFPAEYDAQFVAKAQDREKRDIRVVNTADGKAFEIRNAPKFWADVIRDADALVKLGEPNNDAQEFLFHEKEKPKNCRVVGTDIRNQPIVLCN
ncbi:hypothetical protein K2X30_04430 [bacterium]|nr:hypothetical protein [bacterium]